MNSPTVSTAPTVSPETAAAQSPNLSLGNLGYETRSRTDFRHLWHTVLEKLWILILCTVAGLFLAIGYLARTPKLYQGHIVLEVDIQEPTLVRSDDGASRMRSAFLASQDALRTIEQNLTNRTLLARVMLAEAVGREYIRNSIERRANFAEDTLRYLLEEEERLKANLQKSEAAVAEYKAKTPDALQLGGGANSNTGQNTGTRGGMVEDKLQDLNTKATVAKTERMRLEGELAQIEQAGDNIDALLAVPSIAAAPAVIERRRDVAQVEAAVATLSQRYKEKHPRMIAA